jgi:hypothetical protein
MHNCADDVLAHHDEKVTLPQSHRTSMKERRNANRDRLKKGLSEQGKPAPREFKSQGQLRHENHGAAPGQGLRH